MNNGTLDDSGVMLEESRFWFQKVLIPFMVVVGVTGNTITVMVLTRKRMRSSTNIYLSALAIADIINLFFVFLLTFKHYSHIHDRKYELYWRFYGLSHWLCDAASSTSVWLTVSFTVERYIAVCHPMRGKFFCTENRAKTVTVIVYMFCILTTASTTFEYQLTLNDTEVCHKCPNESSKLTLTGNNEGNNNSNNNSSAVHFIFNNGTLVKGIDLADDVTMLKVLNRCALIDVMKHVQMNCNCNQSCHVYVISTKNNATKLRRDAEEPLQLTSDVENQNQTFNSSVNATDSRTCCSPSLYIGVESTNLGKNHSYTTFMYWYSAMVFGLIPLVLIATFNCFLIRAVYISQKNRRTMTRRNTLTSQTENAVISNENRITIMLIAVVVMFLICQTPTASYLIYYNVYPPETERQRNIQNILGNVFNSLITVNVSCNFVLYSLMSKNFRKTFKELFIKRKNKRQDTIQLSSLRSTNSQKFKPYYHGISRNASEYRTPRNLETTSLTSAPRSKSLIIRPVGKARSTDLVI